MNNSPRSSPFTPNSAFRLLGLALAGWLAGSSPVASGDTITLPYPYYTNQITTVESWVELNTENAIFLTWEDWDTWYPRVLSELGDIDSNAVSFFYQVYAFANRIEGYLNDFEYDADWPDDASDTFLEQWEQLHSDVDNAVRSYQGQAYTVIQTITNGTERVRGVVDELQLYHNRDVITSVSFGQDYGQTLPGGCQCPDYTVYLQGLHADLVQFRRDFQSFTNSFMSAYLESVQILKDFNDGLLTGFDSSYDVGRAFQRLMHQWHLGYNFPTNTPDFPLWVQPTGSVDVLVRNTNEIAVAIGAESMGNLTNAILAILLHVDAIKTNREEQARTEVEEEIDEGERELDGADSDRYNPSEIPSFEFWGVFRSLAAEFQHMSDVFRTHGSGGDAAVSGSTGWRLLSETTFQFGGEDGESVTIPAQNIDMTAGGQATDTATTIFQYCSRLFGLLWDALICLLDFAFIRWLVRLCGSFLGVFSGILSGDLSGLGNIIPKLGEALTHPDN